VKQFLRLNGLATSIALLSFVVLTALSSVALGQVSNLGLHSDGPLATSDAFLAFAVTESEQGNTDLNNDLDMADKVVHVNDGTSTTNLTLALDGEILVSNSFVAFLVSEEDQGHTDLNNDGDTDDTVMHVYDGAGTTNLQLAVVGEFAVSGSFVAFAVSEADQNLTDLNGDSDTSDLVIHVYNGASVTNLSLAANFANTPLITNPAISASDAFVAFGVNELSQNTTDLNGDGDQRDEVVHVYDGTTITNLSLAIRILSGKGVIETSNSFVAFVVPEFAQFNTDLNGDADAFDNVVHVYDGTTTTNLMLQGERLSVSNSFVAFGVFEGFQGNADLNGDADAIDLVVHAYNGVATMNLGLPLLGLLSTSNTFVAFAVWEAGHNTSDLNGDSDTFDAVAHVYDGVTTANLQLAALGTTDSALLSASDSFVAFTVLEASQNATDLNGDADTQDAVVHVYDGTITMNLALATFGISTPILRVSDTFVGFVVAEGSQGSTDLNGDLDLADSVYHVYDGTTITNLQVARGFGDPIISVSSSLVAVVVTEASQNNSDLNNDADTNDLVVHLVSQEDDGETGDEIPAVDLAGLTPGETLEAPGFPASVFCILTVKSGGEGLVERSMFQCHLDFDDLEDEGFSGCDANGNGVVAGENYRVSDENNGECEPSDLVLSYRIRKNGPSCTGLPSVTCTERETDEQFNSDSVCNGEVGGVAAAECAITLRVHRTEVDDLRDTACPNPGDCLTDKDPLGNYGVYWYFTSKIRGARDRFPNTDDNGPPNSPSEVTIRMLENAAP